MEEVSLSSVWYIDTPKPKQDAVFSEVKAQLATIIAMLQQQQLAQKQPEPQPASPPSAKATAKAERGGPK